MSAGMHPSVRSLVLAMSCIVTLSAAEYGYPPPVTGLKRISVPGNPDITITYKEPSNEICRTWYPDQKQFTGHVHLPPSTLTAIRQDYHINTFFWFFEAQHEPKDAPLTIWINGGPGSSSMLGLMQEIGPCKPLPASKESLTTVPREFSWDGASNMLFIDQPNQVGFSYDIPTNGSKPVADPTGLDFYFPGKVAPPQDDQPTSNEIFPANNTFEAFVEATRSTALINGTFSSSNPDFTANTTKIAAVATWHFLQAWLTSFPEYAGSSHVNLFAESYGGIYGPTFFEYFGRQNKRRETGELPKNETVEIKLDALGIVNGCIDALNVYPSYITYGGNNPYGIEAISAENRTMGVDIFERPGGCKEQTLRCRQLVKEFDRDNTGDNDRVNEVCAAAENLCNSIRSLYVPAQRSFYDIAHGVTDPFPGEYHQEYLNNVTVQEAIGAPVNYTQTSGAVFRNFKETGDFIRGGQLESIAYLLEQGVRVALIYGDRDYICNWLGGEAESLSVNYTNSDDFRSAGYQDIEVNGTYIGGQVRQYGGFSFSRIYQAGHLVPSYQPETAYRVFERIIKGLSIATGEKITDVYSTTGTVNSTKSLIAPASPEPTCFYRVIASCDEAGWLHIIDRTGVVYNGVVYNSTDDYPVLEPLPPYPPAPTGKIQQRSTGTSVRAPSAAALLVAIGFCIGLLPGAV